MTCKNRLLYDLYCVGGDVKPCSIQSNGWHDLDLVMLIFVCVQTLVTARTVLRSVETVRLCLNRRASCEVSTLLMSARSSCSSI